MAVMRGGGKLGPNPITMDMRSPTFFRSNLPVSPPSIDPIAVSGDNTSQTNQLGRGQARAVTYSTRTVSNRHPWRTNLDNPTDGVAPAPPMPSRLAWFPGRVDISRTMVQLQSMRNVMRCQLGHDARINENCTMHVPVAVLPNSITQGR